MTNKDIFDYLHTILRKSVKGNAISPYDFSKYLQHANLEFFNQEYDKFEVSQRITDTFSPLVVRTTLSVSNGRAAIPTTAGYEYIHAVSMLYGSVKVDMVTHNEYMDRISDALTAPSATHPIAYVLNISGPAYFMFGGITTGSVTLTYIREPDTPFFDYYLDANKAVKYLTEGQSAYTLLTNEIYRDGTSSGAVTSISKELDWNDNDKMKIANIILGYLGAQMEDPGSYQHSNVKEQKDMLQ